VAKRALIRKKEAIEKIRPVVKEAKEAGKAAEKALKELEGTKGIAGTSTAKRAPAKRTTARKAPARKPAAKRATAKKAPAKTSARPSVAKKPARKTARAAKTSAAKKPSRRAKAKKPSLVSSKIFALRVNSVKSAIDQNKKSALKREKKHADSLKKLRKEILKVSKVSTTLNKIETQTKKDLRGFSDKFAQVETVVAANNKSLNELKDLVSKPSTETQGTVEEIKTLIKGKFVDFSSELEIHGSRLGKIEERLERLETPAEEKLKETVSIYSVSETAKPSSNETEITEPKKEETAKDAEAIALPAPPTSEEIALHDTVSGLKERVSGLEERVSTLASSEKVNSVEARIFEKLDSLNDRIGSAQPDGYAKKQVEDLRTKMLELEDKFLSQPDSERARLAEKRIFDELDSVKQQLKEVVESKVVVQPETTTISKKSVDEVAHDIVDLYFREIARLGFKRKLDLEDTVQAYEFVRNKLSAHQTVTPEMIESEIKARKFKKENQ